MCGRAKRDEMSPLEIEIRDHIVIKLESMFTHDQWEPLLGLLTHEVSTDGCCGAVMHSFNELYEFQPDADPETAEIWRKARRYKPWHS